MSNIIFVDKEFFLVSNFFNFKMKINYNIIRIFLILISTGSFNCFGDAEKIITSIHPLTFVGVRAGEGYFSKDGSRMVFQSERDPSNPFYQIYLADFKTGNIQKVSTGKGKTTCSWIHPSGDKILFSSTHLDPEFESKLKKEFDDRKLNIKSKYAWSYDDQYDIFSFNLKDSKYVQLTHERGYDAEASYSPDGEWIVFASNREAYEDGKMNEEDKKLFQQDNSYMMDIYRMKSNGTQIEKLTSEKGYDGGPFYSFDGKKITWRRFSKNGQSAEIFVMNADGSQQTQITHLKAMSWAPFFHPSGEYIVFTTNLLGYSNFELYIVDVEGKKEPIRVTEIDGFDGLPVFLPSGNKISWTHQNEKGESQIIMANWDHSLALQRLGLRKSKEGVESLLKPKNQLNFKELSAEVKVEDLKKIIQYLASNELQGRATGSDSELKYSSVIADLFKKWGLKPISSVLNGMVNVENGENPYFSYFEFPTSVQMGPKMSFEIWIKDKKLTLNSGVDYLPLSFSKGGDFPKAPSVFAGYGIVAPPTSDQEAYDSYAQLDVKGKWVVVLRDIPDEISNERRYHLSFYSRPYHKALVAAQAGAVGIVLMGGSEDKLSTLKYEGSYESSIPVLQVSNEAADKILQSTGRNLIKWQQSLANGQIQSTPIQDVQMSSTIDLKTIRTKSRNVIGILPAKNATETLVIGGHGDHLGLGELGNSLATKEERGKVHYGADDNASGVAGVLELAHFFSQAQNKNKAQLKQNLMFAIWSGEELGVLGSQNFLKKVSEVQSKTAESEVPSKTAQTKNKNQIKSKEKSIFSAYLNLDMIGRYKDKLFLQGVQSAPEWNGIIEKFSLLQEWKSQKNKDYSLGLNLSLQDDPYLPTDALSFYLNQVPSISFFTGAHSEYHSPRDTENLINYPALMKIVELVKGMTLELGSHSQSIVHYQKVEGSKRDNLTSGRRFRIYLGTIPDYSQEGVKGVKISGTTKNSPAEKAGLKAGDIITALGGVKIENLYDYVYCLQSMKAQQNVIMKIIRSSKELELTVTPELKE